MTHLPVAPSRVPERLANLVAQGRVVAACRALALRGRFRLSEVIAASYAGAAVADGVARTWAEKNRCEVVETLRLLPPVSTVERPVPDLVFRPNGTGSRGRG